MSLCRKILVQQRLHLLWRGCGILQKIAPCHLFCPILYPVLNIGLSLCIKYAKYELNAKNFSRLS